MDSKWGCGTAHQKNVSRRKIMGSNHETGAKPLVLFVGPNSLQNTLLASTLREESDSVECRLIEKMPEEVELGPEQKILILLDSRNMDPFDEAGIMNNVSDHTLKKYPVALFNVPAGNGTRKTALNFGVRGVLFTTDSPKDFRKAVAAILSGDLWYPREAITQQILKNSKRFEPLGKEKPHLTPKEKEILLSLTSGASNEDIANKLRISQHTVRTHLYSIFRKIEVANRTQATLWVARNILTR
jgi:DNA-binding NarL/FixJ family response regulator